MNTDHHEELASLYALDLLDGPEKSRFEQELTRNSSLRQLVADFTHATASLSFAVPQITPPDTLKNRILTAVDSPASSQPAKVIAFPLSRLLPWAVAAALALSTVWLATQNQALRAENQNLQTERQLAQIAYQTVQGQLASRSLLAEKIISDLGQQLRHTEDLARLKITALASLAGNTKEAQVIAVWDPTQQTGLLTLEKLPVIADTQDYQIWIVDPAYPNPVNGGVFHIATDGKIALPFKPDQPIKQAAAFAISLEKKGGVPKAEGPIVLLGK